MINNTTFMLNAALKGPKTRKIKKEYPETASLCYNGFIERGAWQCFQKFIQERNIWRKYVLSPFRNIKDGYPRYIISLDKYRDQQEGVHHINAIDLFLGKEQIWEIERIIKIPLFFL